MGLPGSLDSEGQALAERLALVVRLSPAGALVWYSVAQPCAHLVGGSRLSLGCVREADDARCVVLCCVFLCGSPGRARTRRGRFGRCCPTGCVRRDSPSHRVDMFVGDLLAPRILRPHICAPSAPEQPSNKSRLKTSPKANGGRAASPVVRQKNTRATPVTFSSSLCLRAACQGWRSVRHRRCKSLRAADLTCLSALSPVPPAAGLGRIHA